MTMANAVGIALIGLGNVGTTFARGFRAAGGYELTAYDISIDDAARRCALVEKANDIGVRLCGSAAEAAKGATIVISGVTESAASDVAKLAASHMKPGQFFLDLNAGTPRTKRRDSEAVESSGAGYVEGAFIVPIGKHGMKVPIALAGKHAVALKALLDPAGMRLELDDLEIGMANAVKICRSVMIKGLEAVTVECFSLARLYGVEKQILATLAESFPTLDLEEFAGYRIGRPVEHGSRRAAEMRETAEAVAEAGLTPFMTRASAERMQWVADLVAQRPELKKLKDSEWREMLDGMAREAKLLRLSDK
jgi:3-hydroxyisobutyrate dehydrogenase-like beta-hydroxyacid dehydrogenase